LIGEFLKVYRSKMPSKLDTNRFAFCQSVAAKLRTDSASITNALRRVLIWEQVQKEGLEQKIEHLLSQEYLVPTSRSRAARLELVEAVRLARDQRVDAIPKLKAVAAKFAGTRLLFEEYLRRGLETSLFDDLKRQRVLLLTGQSMCGKSQTARYLAEEFQKAGFTCEIGNDVHEAIRCLHAVGQDDRLFLLDDPFGHLELRPNAAEDLSRLKNLIATLPTHRFLIVTSRWDIVSLLGAKQPIYGAAWHDLTITDAAFLTEFWRIKCFGKGLSAAAFKTVLQNLPSMNRDELLQPGQLLHLASINEPVPDLDIGALCALARCNSTDLANNFKLRGAAAQHLHAALALGATSIDPLPLRCLDYVLSVNQSHPGILQRDEFDIVRLGQDDPPPAFPSQPDVPQINGPLRDELSLLEQRGFIRVVGTTIMFAHPDYFEASTLVLLGFPATKFEELIGITAGAITCLYPTTAKKALRQLIRMYNRYSDADQRRSILELAFLAFNSIFPSVRDLALTTLVSWIEGMAKSDQKRVLNLVKRTDLGYDDILWHDGVPWLNPKPRTSFERLFDIGRPARAESLAKSLTTRLLDSNGRNTLSIRGAWVLSNLLRRKPRGIWGFPLQHMSRGIECWNTPSNALILPTSDWVFGKCCALL
jgi:hypothetical protein